MTLHTGRAMTTLQPGKDLHAIDSGVALGKVSMTFIAILAHNISMSSELFYEPGKPLGDITFGISTLRL